jgi:phosphatidate phosphatase APP1
MKTKITSLFFALILSLGSVSFAQTLLITDIDDTLKMSHVLDTLSVVDSSIALRDRFLGMSELYQAVATSDSVKIAYVSNAPASLMTTLHRQFLALNNFPKGGLYLKETMFQTGFKLKIIRQLLKDLKPSQVVMVGDNGESDPEIYAQIQDEFPHISFSTFIHQVYSVQNPTETGNSLKPGQKGFVTSVDLTLHFHQMGLLPEAKAHSMVEQSIPRILEEREDEITGELAFPAWMDCRDFQISVNDPSELFQKFMKKTARRCSQP